MRVIDRTGDRYGRLVVIERASAKSRTDTNARWFCRCDCGRGVVAYGQDLGRGRHKSCGCLNAERIIQHGMSHSHVYRVWQAMLQRCENPNNPAYSNYGGRGIAVCERWHRFENFFADMGNRPVGYSLDRKENDEGYCKENCRWATTTQQARNKQKSRVIEYQGEKATLAEWAQRKGMGWYTLRSRLDYNGWDIEKALNEPLSRAKLYSYRGRKLTLSEWATETGISIDILRYRHIRSDWPFAKAITTPVGFRLIRSKE